MAKYLKKVLH